MSELRTLAAIIDGICQNDAMRSLDIAVQRFKSIEMYMGQGSWEQGNLLARGRSPIILPARAESHAAGAEDRAEAPDSSMVEPTADLDTPMGSGPGEDR